jgi:hypothetical protein
VLLADVSELSIGSIFIGRWMKNGSGWGGRVYIPVERGSGREGPGQWERGMAVIGGWM